jgi:FdhE protein
MGRPDDVAARLEEVIGLPHVADAFIRFRLDLVAAQQQARSALAPAVTDPDRPCALPLGPADVQFPAEALASLFAALRVAATAHGRDTDDMQRLAAAVAADPELLPTVARAAAFGPDLATLEAVARRYGVLVDAVHFVGRALAAPCLAAAVAARHGDSSSGERGDPHRCPACSAPPSIARLRRDDGGRILTCGLCGTDWQAPRLACACCGTRLSTALGLLRVDDDNPRWVETCDECGGYIKTVDERRLAVGEAVSAVVEEAATLHLDLLAEREGYVRRVAYVLSG